MAKAIALLGIAVVLAGLAYAGWTYEYGSERTVTFTVQSLDDQVTDSNGQISHQYLVFTTSGAVYKDTDDWLQGKTDSSSVYAFLDHPGWTFRCPVNGYRNTFSSSYPDILDGCKVVSRG